MLKLLIVVAAIASAESLEPWIVSYKHSTETGKDIVEVQTRVGGGVILSLEDHPNTMPVPRRTVVYLNAEETTELARVLLGRVSSRRGGKSFSELGEEAARETSKQLCAEGRVPPSIFLMECQAFLDIGKTREQLEAGIRIYERISADVDTEPADAEYVNGRIRRMRSALQNLKEPAR